MIKINNFIVYIVLNFHYDFVYVDQESFQKYKVESFEELKQILIKYH